MLIRFRVTNHRSLRDEQVLSMVAAAPLDDPRLISSPAIEEKLLPAIAIYGANASGKSNVLDALAFMCSAVEDSQTSWSPTKPPPRRPFALSADGPSAPSSYEVDIIVDGVHFTYGFVITTERIGEEWLLRHEAGEASVVFERTDDVFEFAPSLAGPNEAIRALTRPNSLFLSAAAQNNHPALTAIFGWFARLVPPGDVGPVSIPAETEAGWTATYLAELAPESRASSLRDIRDLLHVADTGIEEIRVVGEGDAARLELRHAAAGGGLPWLALSEESGGTRRLVNLEMALGAARLGLVSCIDEFESRIHPAVALELLRAHNEAPHRGQLLLTTHDALLLHPLEGEAPLRRDQIWLTEKDREGKTTLYPLSDIEPQEPENLARGYLQGRYGAVPFVGDRAVLLKSGG